MPTKPTLKITELDIVKFLVGVDVQCESEIRQPLMPCTAVVMRMAAEGRRSDDDEDLDMKAPAPAQCPACNTRFHTAQ